MELLAEYEGNYTRWHDNGNLWVQACKKNGKFEGECREWYENGQLCEYGFYRNGLQEGKHKTWNEDGKIAIDEILQGGLREGIAILWYGNGGNSFARELYRNGKRQGESVYWNKTLSYYPSRFYFYDGYVIDPHFNLRKRRIFLRYRKSYLPISRTAINNLLIKDLLSEIIA